MRVYLESLGCARNQVDSETMLAQLESAGMRITDDPSLADTIIVNTCSFIESAADESIDAILALAAHKQSHPGRRLIVTGCLPERYREQIVEALPEVDLFLGTGAYDRIVAAVRGGLAANACLLPDPDEIDIREPAARKPLVAHAAYLKIAEGCSRHCTYCIIPKLRGRQKSRPVDTLCQEARALIAAGARELTLVAQETTAYGRDLVPPADLAGLLDAVARIDDSVWVRCMYGHPESMTQEVMRAMAEHANICPYLDIPVQHAATGVLRRMGRAYDRDGLLRLFEAIRARIPDVALRTTVLVGFPGETDDDFKQLKAFISAVGFEHLGVFAYSDAQDLPSHRLDHRVDAGIAQARLAELMALQQDLSAESLTKYQGRRMPVLIEEGPQEDGAWIGRTRYQAPEVDGFTLIRPTPAAAQLSQGRLVQVRIIETLDYDLIAEVV